MLQHLLPHIIFIRSARSVRSVLGDHALGLLGEAE
ncbi:hypothetical protein EAI_02583 [Harpegnathos saltator]|uniref:Uncharacterized protein n=1 Tax=Harpegnathos saltator TaxID=610380 RepID=E2C7Z9_HARSA|nr:hypothetical protein EAI_02583 [Harpegnathos saltator]